MNTAHASAMGLCGVLALVAALAAVGPGGCAADTTARRPARQSQILLGSGEGSIVGLTGDHAVRRREELATAGPCALFRVDPLDVGPAARLRQRTRSVVPADDLGWAARPVQRQTREDGVVVEILRETSPPAATHATPTPAGPVVHLGVLLTHPDEPWTPRRLLECSVPATAGELAIPAPLVLAAFAGDWTPFQCTHEACSVSWRAAPARVGAAAPASPTLQIHVEVASGRRPRPPKPAALLVSAGAP